MENKLNYKRKIGAILRFLKLKIFLFFVFKKIIFYLLVFVGELNMSNKNKKKIDDNCQKDRKFEEE